MTTTPSEIFIKKCQEKNVDQYYIDGFSKDPQELWDSCENPYNMFYLLSKFSGEVSSTSRKATTKCLIETVKPCMKNIKKGEKRPLRLMEVLEKYCEGTATIEEVRKARDNFNAISENASCAVCLCASFALVKYDYASDAAFHAANSEGGKEDQAQYNKNSCKIIRKHFPTIPGLESVKTKTTKSNQGNISITKVPMFTLSLKGETFTLTNAELSSLEEEIKNSRK